MRATAPSPWTSEEGKEFLQGRTGDFARSLFWVAAFFWMVGWALASALPARGVEFSPFGGAQLFNLAIAALFLLEWRLLRRAPLPVEAVLNGGRNTLDSAARTLVVGRQPDRAAR